MRLFVDDGSGKRPVENLSFQQTKQAAAIMDCVGRLIPQEGVDYDVDVIFKGAYDQNVSMSITPRTDKGAWWRSYVLKMIDKYPPTVDNPPQSIEDDQTTDKDEEVKGTANEKIVS